MNEILNNRIKEVVGRKTEIFYQHFPISYHIRKLQEGFKKGFLVGAEYAICNQWIRVEEALPPYDEAVLVIDKTNFNDGEQGAYFNHRSNDPNAKTYKNGFCDLFGEGGEVMYWMPIPKLNVK